MSARAAVVQLPGIRHCVFCLWEGTDDINVCPDCHEYKGLTPGYCPLQRSKHVNPVFKLVDSIISGVEQRMPRIEPEDRPDDSDRAAAYEEWLQDPVEQEEFQDWLDAQAARHGH